MAETWYILVPDVVLALLMYVTAARLVLSFFVDPDAETVLNRAVMRVTDPVVGVVRIVTPLFVSARFLLAFSCLWLLFARFALRYALLGPNPGSLAGS